LSRVICSLYIDIQNPVSHFKNKEKFNNNLNWLLDKQQEYAKLCQADYAHFTYDDKFIKFSKKFGPEISEYNIINFYKMHLLYQLDYDEILYLDMDVIPVTTKNFFDEWDLTKRIAVMSEEWSTKDYNRSKHNVRSPLAKYWNAYALLGYGKEVFNTGIIGASKTSLKELNYFKQFKKTLKKMKTLTTDDFWPEDIRNLFGYDNETLFAYRIKEYQQLLDTGWHHFMYRWNYIPKNTKLVHCINKDFDYVRKWCEKNNI